MTKPVYTIELTRNDHLFTEIAVHKSGHGRMVFGGDGMWQWGFGTGSSDGSLDHLRSHRKKICWAEWLHNGLLGMHTCILYAEGGPFVVHDRHADYDFMNKLWDFANMLESDVLKLSDEELKVENL
jgi:hypothetical protein